MLPIHTVPDPVLRQKAKRVRLIDDSIHRLISNMIETMHAAPGVGLAAPQVGIPLRVVVIGIPEQEEIVLINPEIVKIAGERWVSEGCLSIPGYVGEIKRAEAVTVKGRNRNGQQIRLRAKDLLAQALEHELDHLNGVLYIDRLENKDQLRKVEPEKPEADRTDNNKKE
ncbi:MAG: peptide deformylase [Chloroflexi bacterium]|nr:peptide deformylase [Chloroflexota bacterium]